MVMFLDRIDAAPIQNNDFPFDFNQWLAVLVDTLNEDIVDTQNAFNLLKAQSYTSAEITAMAADLPNGIILYDSDLDLYVGKQAGVLTKFTTAAYP